MSTQPLPVKQSKNLTNEESSVLFKHLGLDPLNQFCFDCQTRNPSWASLEFGVRICLECAAHHRNLGRHITFVRSVNFDTWRVEQIATMLLGGNQRASTFMKANGGSGIGEIPTSGHTGKYTDAAANAYRLQLKREVAAGQDALYARMIQLVPRVAELLSLTSTTVQQKSETATNAQTIGAPEKPAAVAASSISSSVTPSASTSPTLSTPLPVLLDPSLLTASTPVTIPIVNASTTSATSTSAPSSGIASGSLLRLGASSMASVTAAQSSSLSTKGKGGAASIGSLLGPRASSTTTQGSSSMMMAPAPALSTAASSSAGTGGDDFDFGTW